MTDEVYEITRALRSLNSLAKRKIDDLTKFANQMKYRSEDFISILDIELRAVN